MTFCLMQFISMFFFLKVFSECFLKKLDIQILNKQLNVYSYFLKMHDDLREIVPLMYEKTREFLERWK